MSALNRLYRRLPVAMQNMAISGYGLYWKRRRFGGVFENELRLYKEREELTAEGWRAHQTVELRRLLLHAFRTVPYYRRTYSAAGFREAEFHRFELEDLKRLPFLEKADLRRFGRTELVSTQREDGGAFFASSGSTGTPTSILYSHAFHQRWSAAFEARVRHWAGVDRQTPRGMIGGRRVVPEADAEPPYYRYNCFERQTYFSAYHISKRTVANYIEGMRRHRVAYMTGYAMSNFFLARTIKELGMEAPQLHGVVTSSEKLTRPMRSIFHDVYGCPTFDGYSGVEACSLISENEFGELAISPDVGIVELLDENGQEVKSDVAGEVVSTGLLNFDQPLIRYRIGDYARRAAEQASQSGREMPLVGEISGRTEDRVIGPDGREMVRFHGVFVDLPHICSAQVVQEAIDHITIRVISEEGFSSAEECIITDRVRSQLGDVEVKIVRVEELATTESGKVKAVISELKTP